MHGNSTELPWTADTEVSGTEKKNEKKRSENATVVVAKDIKENVTVLDWQLNSLALLCSTQTHNSHFVGEI